MRRRVALLRISAAAPGSGAGLAPRLGLALKAMRTRIVSGVALESSGVVWGVGVIEPLEEG